MHLEANHTPFFGKDQNFFQGKKKSNKIQNGGTLCYNFQEQRITKCILDQSEKGEINSWK
jgi:hypothetical protein